MLLSEEPTYFIRLGTVTEHGPDDAVIEPWLSEVFLGFNAPGQRCVRVACAVVPGRLPPAPPQPAGAHAVMQGARARKARDCA